MPLTSIKDLNPAIAAALPQLLEVVTDPDGTPLSESVTVQQIVDLMNANTNHAARHVGGDDAIPEATAVQTGLATSTQVTKLDSIEAGAEVNNMVDADVADLTDGGDSALHYHAADRDRANHTGTQLASTISDFDTAVGANPDIAANTAKVSADGSVTTHNDVTDAGSGAIITGAERTKLDGIEAGAEVNNISDPHVPDLTDGVDSSLHYHDADRDRANHTGTQTSATISDFNAEVSANTNVVANTAKVSADGSVTTHNDVTDAGSGEIITNIERTKLLGIESGAEVNNISDPNATDLTDGGDSSLHYHAVDRNRANHSGTQTANTISDFDAAVSANPDIVANTAKVSADGPVTTHSDVTDAGSGAIITGAERTKLDGIEAGAEVNNISDIDATDLTNGFESTLHYHAADRARANHTGTQTASTISDFDAAVSANPAIAANTAKVSADGSVITHSDVTDAGSGVIISAAERSKLAGIEAGAEVNNIADVDVAELTAGNDSDLHYHAADRIRTNHTGFQAASTISDFQTTVSNNSDVAANTVHSGIITGNPHVVTKADVGLSDVVNVDTTNASNITSGTLSSAVLPPIALTTVFTVADQTEQLALTAEEGDVAVRTDLGKSFMKNSGTAGTMTDWTELQTPTDSVLSVNGQTGTVFLSTNDLVADADRKFVTDAEKVLLGNLSGVNSGDVTVVDSAEIDLSITGQALTASLQAASIAKAKLDAGVSASLDLADSALQVSDIGVSVQGYSAILAGTTASYTTISESKLAGIEDGADVTDSANVAAAGAVMETDASTVDMSFVIDEDDMLSNLATKIPTQQSVKAYVDAQILTAGNVDSVNGFTGDVVLSTGDLTEDVNKNYVTDSQLTLLGNTSGINTGDVTVTDSAEIDFTLTGQDITASLIAGSIDETKLDISVNASLDLADSALQSTDIGSSVQAWSSVLDATTASFLVADETKLDFISVTQAVNLDTLDTIETDTNLNNTHRTSDGSDHTFIDQDITTTASPAHVGMRLTGLNSGDEVIITDTLGELQESGVKVETAPAGGSGFTVVEYAAAPVSPTAGFLWVQAKDANTKTLNYTSDGVTIFSVDMSV